MTWYPEHRLSRLERAGALCLLAVAAAVVIACGGGGPPRGLVPPALDGYPASPAMNGVIENHVQAVTDGRENRVLLMTWFLNGDPRVAQNCSVRADGRVVKYQYVHTVQMTNQGSGQLTTPAMAELQRLLAQLPSTTRPPTDRMVIISFRDPSGGWDTRVYDRTARPPAVDALYELTGAPIDPEVRQ